VIAKLSIIGVFASGAYIICIVAGSITAFTTYDSLHRAYNFAPPKIGKIPMTACVMLFGFNCQYAVPAVRSAMKKPDRCQYCIGVAHFLVGTVYLLAGLVGYWGWGNRVAGNVLKAMCEAPGCEHPSGLNPGILMYENWEGGAKMFVGKILACAVVANLIVTIPLNTDILFKVWEAKLEVIKTNFLVNMVAREATVALLLVVAISIPFFKEFLNLISSVLVTLLGILVPVAFAVKMDNSEGRKWPKVVNCVFLLVGLVCMVLGTKSAIEQLIEVMNANTTPPNMDPSAAVTKAVKDVASRTNAAANVTA